MCGIAGFWEPNNPSSTIKKDLAAMTCVLHHRGPDGQGSHIDQRRGLAMGHTRLSIIDLKTGDQPLYGDGKSLILTTNGEFYDYKRHRAELACEGVRFRTKSDAEIAIPFYQEHGLDFVHKLRGEFAVALFDEEQERLILVRDRFGIKPLYYRLNDDAVYYGSEVKAVLGNPRVSRDLCPKAAIHQMMQVMVPGTTAFQSVRTLLPGHMLIIRREGHRLVSRDIKYWDLEFPAEADHAYGDEPRRYIDRVRDLLIDAVATRLEADVPVGCYLSGGIDSCAMLGLATPLQQSPVKAFTISFDHDDYDEASIAREMAERTCADQELLKLTAADLYGPFFERVTWHTERTFYNTLSVAKWHMSRRVNECGFKVVVTGEGSDELFGGYPFFKRDMFLHGTHAGDDQVKSGGVDGVFQGAILAETEQSHPAWDDLCGFTPSWIQPWMLTLQTCRPLFAPELQELLSTYDPIAAVAEAIDPKMIRNRHALDKSQYTWSKTMLEGQILTWGGDRVDMANSMESRPAFLDHHLAEFAVTIPPNMRIRDGVEKWVLREAMKGVLPEILYKRQKFAFMAPPSHTDTAKREAVEALVDKWLTPDHIRQASLFDPSQVSDMLTRWRSDTDPTSAKRLDIVINHLLQLHILHETFTHQERGATIAPVGC